MKHLRLKRLYGLILAGALSILHVPIVFADAGDTIANQATLEFTVGGGPANFLESDPAGNSVLGVGSGALTTDFVEDRVINFSVAEVNGATTLVSPSATLQVQQFTVTNNGNGPQDFIFRAFDQANGTADPHGGVVDNFDTTPATVQVFVDSAAADTGTDTFAALVDTGIFMDELDPGVTRTVYVVATIPNAATVSNGDLAVLTLVAQVAEGGAAAANETAAANAGAPIINDDNARVSPAGVFSNGATDTTAAVNAAILAGAALDVADIATGAGAEQVVFNDPAGGTATDEDSTGAAQDAVENGQHSDSSSYTVGAAELTVTKTAAILWDPVNANNNPKAIPGAYMRYTVTIANAGTAGASADLTELADTLQTGVAGALVLDPDFVDGSAAAGALPAAIQATNTNGVGESFDVALTVTTRTTDPVSCSTIDGPDVDGCVYAAPAITISFATLLPAEDIAPAGAGAEDYVAGELKPGDTVTIMFNVIVQP